MVLLLRQALKRLVENRGSFRHGDPLQILTAKKQPFYQTIAPRGLSVSGAWLREWRVACA